jgi:hypothetical protein
MRKTGTKVKILLLLQSSVSRLAASDKAFHLTVGKFALEAA